MVSEELVVGPPRSPAQQLVGPAVLPTALPVDDQIQIDMMKLRKKVSREITALFVSANKWMLIGLGAIYLVQSVLELTGHQTPNDRIIDSTVIKTLIGATTVQLGAIALSMARFLFPSTGNVSANKISKNQPSPRRETAKPKSAAV